MHQVSCLPFNSPLAKKLFFLFLDLLTTRLDTISITRMFMSLPFTPRTLQATESRLQKIYDAAKKGLKNDSLALAAGMLPTEYRQLCQFDPVAEMAALKGKADGELEMSTLLIKAAKEGDAKSALAVLQHVHGWTAKTEISVDVYQKISITQALADAQQRVANGITIEHNATASL